MSRRIALCLSAFLVVSAYCDDWQNARAAAPSTSKAAPKTFQQLIDEGQTKYDKDQDDAAIDAYTKAITMNPKSDLAYYLRGLAYTYGKDDDKRAIADFRKAIAINPTRHEYHLQLGKSLYYVDDEAEAVAALTKAIELHKNDSAKKEREGTAYALRRYGEKMQGIGYHYRAQSEKERAEYYHYRAKSYMQLNKTAEAIADFDQAMILDSRGAPQSVALVIDRAKAYLQVGKTDLALRDYGRIKNYSLSGYELEERAELAEKLHLHEEALKDYRKYAEDKTLSFGRLHGRALIASSLGLFKEAIADYEEAIKKNPKKACHYNNVSNEQKEIGQWQQALDNSKKAVTLQPIHADHFSNLARTEEQFGMKAEAIEHADKAIEIANQTLKKNAADETALQAKCDAYMIKGMYDDALKVAAETEKVNQDYAYVHYAEIYARMGKKEEALGYFDKIVQHSKSNWARYHRGKLLKELGRTQEGEADMKAATDAGYLPPPKPVI